MKKLAVVMAVLIAIIIINSCEVEKPVRYFEINGLRHDLQTGLMDNWGTNTTGVINSRSYAISFRSSEAYPENYITFLIGSLNTEDLEQGNYYFDDIGGRGYFSDMRIGSNMRYANDGSFTGGAVFSEADFIIDGVMRVSTSSKGNLDFYFDINLAARDANNSDFPDSVYKITGEFNDRLLLNTNDVDLETY